jgi:HNH endonuclease/NUMOD4 motif
MVKWKSAFGLRGLYEVSDDGQVMRVATHGRNPKSIRRPLRPHKKPNGYLAVDMQQDQERHRFYVHRLVWQTFRGEIPIGLEINHRNGDRADNRLENLELTTRSDNMLHCFQTLNPSLKRSFGATHHKAKLSEDDVKEVLRLSKAGNSRNKIAELFGVSGTAIGYILSGRNWKQLTGLG